MNTAVLDAYLKHAQQLSCRLDCEPSALQELLHTIELNKDAIGRDPALEEFFKGEYAFYSSHYERALKHYLEAKSIEKFEFFCFRASAFVSKTQGHIDKAIGFAKRALDILPDYSTLNLLGELLVQSGHSEEGQEAIAKARMLNENQPSSKPSAQQKVTIGEKEIHELASIFLPSPVEEGLFAAESISPYDISPEKGHEPSYQGLKPGKKVINGDTDIEQAIDTFQEVQSRLIVDYFTKWKSRPPMPDHCLYVLQGWEEHLKTSKNLLGNAFDDAVLSLLTEDALKSSGGIFIRWNGKGIAINPGKNFLKNFHRSGLHLKDIDYVISTNDDPDTYADIKKIHDLAFQLNTKTPELQIIHYYLNQKAFHQLSGILKPHFKQERNAVHRLEWFEGSLEMEKIEICPGICLHYFSWERSAAAPLSLGVRLELTLVERSTISRTFNLGYISGYCSPFHWVNFGHCDALLMGIGKGICKAKLKKTPGSNQNNDIQSLINEFSPKLLLCTEFDGFEGDLRLETVRKLREEGSAYSSMAILPADNGLFLDLKTLSIKGTFDVSMIDAKAVHVTRSAGAFSTLMYLPPASVL